jgi:flagellar hook-length control protein FliK
MDDSKAPSRSDDDKTAKASDEPSKTDAATIDAKAPADKKAEAEPKSEGKKDAKSETDAKASELVVATATPDAKPADAAAAQAAVATAVPTLTPADAVAAAVPAAAEAATDKPAADAAAAEAAIGAVGKGKTGKSADAKTANGKPAEEAKAGAETGKTEGEDQTGKTAANPEKVQKADAHARGEAQFKENPAATVAPADKSALDPAQAAPQTNVDATQTAALTARTQQATPAAATAATAAAAPVAQQAAAIPLSGVAFEIASKAQSSTNHFEIRLDPPELGRIEVRLDVDKDGNVTSNMIVDRPETLDLLRRDAGGLDRALQDAGLKTSNNGLQFQLRDQSGQQQQQGQSSANTARLVVQDENFTNAAIARDYGRLAGQGSGVDIHV